MQRIVTINTAYKPTSTLTVGIFTAEVTFVRVIGENFKASGGANIPYGIIEVTFNDTKYVLGTEEEPVDLWFNVVTWDDMNGMIRRNDGFPEGHESDFRKLMDVLRPYRLTS